MPSNRLALALRELEPGDWQIFERFASEFLAVEYPSLRTTASPSGDKGRDAQLFVADEAPKTVFQYSVASDWRDKIGATARKLAETMPDITRLVYCTNQVIGPESDDLVETFRTKRGISLDIRDHSWFVERELTAPQREIAADELGKRIVDPLLSRDGIKAASATMLSDDDARVALLHLTLEGYDANSDRNLTKSCFEALVLAALHDTDAENLLTADEICEVARNQVPAEDPGQVDAQIDGAIKRLSAKNGPVKFLSRTKSYHLSFDAQRERSDRTVAFLARQRALEDELIAAIELLNLDIKPEAIVELGKQLREGAETVLLHRGEAFARTVTTGVMNQVDVDEILAWLTEQGHSMAPLSREAAAEVVFTVLESPSPQIQEHLADLADAYTLFAFLRQTADVQKVVLDIFQFGEIWLDSTVVLPLLGESLLEDEAERHYTVLLKAALDAGFKLYVTDGVVEEIERHLNRALLFARTSQSEWRSGVPFLYAAFALSGRSRSEFFDWLAEFRGDVTPEDDIKDYLQDEFSIQSRNLQVEAERASAELRGAVQEIWHEAHEQRRKRSGRNDITDDRISRLIAHDVENSVGVMQLRKGTDRKITGYSQWWLTLDRVAFTLSAKLRDRMAGFPPPSPALSPDFLSQLLRLGPLRSAVATERHATLPILTAISKYESVPRELVDLADETRKRYAGQSERAIQRRVRDAMNGMRWRRSKETHAGMRGAEERLKARLDAQARRRA